MAKTAVVTFLIFYFLLWMAAAVNTNQWMPPHFSFVPEGPRVLAGFISAFVIFLFTAGLIKGLENFIFGLAKRVPKTASVFLYNLLFLIAAGIITAIMFFISYESLIAGGLYKIYLPEFYVVAERNISQITTISVLCFILLFIVSFLSMRRKIVIDASSSVRA